MSNPRNPLKTGLTSHTHCGFDIHGDTAVSASVSLENVLLDVKELQRGMDLTKREYTMHDHNTLLKEFILNNEGKLKKLQDDAKIAQVSTCSLDTHEEVTESLKPTWVPVLALGEDCPLSTEGRFSYGTNDYWTWKCPVLLIVLF